MASELEKQYKRRGFTESGAAAKAMKHDGMVDMKRSKKEAKMASEPMKTSPGEDYPYGLEIRLGKDEMKKLGMNLPTVGGTVSLTAKAKVKSASMRKDSDGDSMDCCLQITKLKID